MSKLLLTQSLLSDFAWVFRKEDGYAEFLRTLRREPKPQSDAMMDGIEFERMVTDCANGSEVDPKHPWARCAQEVGDECRGGQFQVRLSREITVDGIGFLCYGVLDCLKAGVITDIKFSKTYGVGKYLESPQHPMYFFICPEAYLFQYLACDGDWIYRESYAPDITEPISTYIHQFVQWINQHGLMGEYIKNWQSL